MSFCSEVKEKCMEHPPKSNCCKRAFISGILFARGEFREDRIRLRLEKSIAAYVGGLLSAQGCKELTMEHAKDGGRGILLSFSSPYYHSVLEEYMGNAPYIHRKCPSCESSFLQGLFLSSGRVTDPSKQYCLEISPAFRNREVKDLLGDLGFSLSLNTRGKETVLYTKRSETVEDFLSCIGCAFASFDLMNCKINAQIRANANRIANFETTNIARAVSASAKIVSEIEELERDGLIHSLPPDLENVAKLRLAHPDLSLSQLCAVCVPPLTKSGLAHRLEKIQKYYDEKYKTKGGQA